MGGFYHKATSTVFVKTKKWERSGLKGMVYEKVGDAPMKIAKKKNIANFKRPK